MPWLLCVAYTKTGSFTHAHTCTIFCSEDSSDQVEAMYMRKRFQGLSLEEQRRMKQKGKKNFLQRRSSRSSAADSTLKRDSGAQPGFQGSSSHIAARARPPGNPFGLQVCTVTI